VRSGFCWSVSNITPTCFGKWLPSLGGRRCLISYSSSVYNTLLLVLVFSRWAGFWQEPEPSQVTGMALARCILGKFLGVVCHCFPLPLDVSTFAARCLHVPINASAPSSVRWKCEREWSGNFSEIKPFLRHLGIFYMPQICDMGKTALLPFRRKAWWGFFPIKYK
jgi:hypothetical protein